MKPDIGSPPPAGRADHKLAAGLRRFGLGGKVKDAEAVDIGASVGGFTGCLLRFGARRVTAVDVGRGQLHTSLARDPRVVRLEGEDWRRLPLAQAPGPFDFFTVDVSFVAARNMLRGLAFRLRPGAEGVVLVKPQFELPPARVRDHRDDPQLRREALERVRARGAELGFEVVGHMDSPVAGRGGTVEVLAHLRFHARSEKLPRPGERRRPSSDVSTPSAPRSRKPREVLRWFVVTAPGLESIVLEQARALGAAAARAVPGGVELEGGPEVGYAANLHLRCATRVLVRVGEVQAREFARLRRGAGRLSWEELVAPGTTVKVSASATRCRLFHTGALAETIEHAIADRLRRGPAAPGVAEPAVLILVRGVDDRFTLSVDSSGELLHRRGWRHATGRAPLRETLAAAVLELCRYDPAAPFVDPMCGVGTLALEACAVATRRPPGIGRGFAFERWPEFDASTWQRLRAEASSAVLQAPPAAIVAADQDAEAIALAMQNAARAGLAEQVRFQHTAFADVAVPAGPGLVALNPPYGRRLDEWVRPGRRLSDLYRDIGRVLRARFSGWRAGILLPRGSLAGRLGLPVLSSTPLLNGGIRVELIQVQVP